jgi:signal transduction histidine kinase
VYFCWLDVLESAGGDRSATVVVAVDDGAVTFELRLAGAAISDDVLSRMRDRVEPIGGRLTIESRPDGGTSARGWIPPS